jgi:chromosome segregation ATPase
MNAYEICAAVLKLEMERDAAKAAWHPAPTKYPTHDWLNDELANTKQHVRDLQEHIMKDQKEIKSLRAAEDDNLRAIENWRNDLDNRTMQLNDVQAQMKVVRDTLHRETLKSDNLWRTAEARGAQVAALRDLIAKYGSQMVMEASLKL